MRKQKAKNPPIAIILCATKSDTMAELLQLDNSGIHVAQYITRYTLKGLEKRFMDSIKNAKIHLEQRDTEIGLIKNKK